ncbi:nucleoside transporter-domain-containing protein [Syncephalis plumigaleata]|nr:nucleoside transporter-domain-containing protein [Syncephalis plumigaleata]
MSFNDTAYSNEMSTKQHAWSSSALAEVNEKCPPTPYNDIKDVNKADTPPRDKFFLAYGIFFIQGISMLLPWNVFITASEYFTFAFRGGHFAGNFQNYFSICFMLFNMIFICMAVVRQHKANTYFAIILTLMTITGITSSYLQNALFGLGARLPPIYVQGFLTSRWINLVACSIDHCIVVGCQTAGTLESVNRRAIIYFAFSAALVLVSIVTYLLMRRLPIYRYYNQSDNALGQITTITLQNYTRKDTICVGRRIWKYGLAVLLTLFVTLALFPSITASITSTQPDGARWRSREVFVLIHFVIFNAGDMLGKMLPALLPIQNDRALLILSLLRMGFAPLFVLSNVQYGSSDVMTRTTPVVFGDAAYYVILMLFSVTNGWIGTCVMMYGPEKVPRLIVAIPA